MRKIICVLLSAFSICGTALLFCSCGKNNCIYIRYAEYSFPFEFQKDEEIYMNATPPVGYENLGFYLDDGTKMFDSAGVLCNEPKLKELLKFKVGATEEHPIVVHMKTKVK